MSVLLITTDLMTSSQVQGTTVCPPASAIDRITAESPPLVLLDLTAPGVDPAALVTAMDGRPVVAFGPHVHEGKLQAARDAGCTAVLSRGQFFRDPGAVIARYVDADDS